MGFLTFHRVGRDPVAYCPRCLINLFRTDGVRVTTDILCVHYLFWCDCGETTWLTNAQLSNFTSIDRRDIRRWLIRLQK